MYSRTLSILLVLVVTGAVAAAPMTAVDVASAGVETPEMSNTDGPRIAVEETSGEQTVIVRLVERPAMATQAAPPEKRQSQLRAHAADSQSSFEKFAAGNPHVSIERSFWITNSLVVTVDTDRIPVERLGFVENVAAVHEDFEVEINTASAATPTAVMGSTDRIEATASGVDATWGLEMIRAPDTWAAFENRGDGVRIAVLDTGVDPEHPDIDVAGWKDFNNNPSPTPLDYGDHGTHVSGTVVGGNASGTAIGVAPEAELYHGAVLTSCSQSSCSGTFSQIVDGIEWAVDNDAAVVSMSLGASGYRSEFIDPIRNARDAGTVPITSSGNSNAGSSSSPGNVYDAVSVGATTSSDTVASFSSGERIDTADAWGSDAPDDWPDEYVVPDISAPGHSIESAVPGGYENKSGTSMAAPHISGAIALLLSNGDGELSPTEIEQLLTSEAVDIGESESRQGAGRLDVYNATLAYSRATLEPTISPQQANVSVPTTLAVEANHPLTAVYWEFEDGTTVRTTASTVERSFELLSTTETVTVTVADERGNITTTQTDIDVVDNYPPVATLTANRTTGVEVGLDTVAFDASNSTDNDEIDRYEWAFGDGVAVATDEPTVKHQYNSTGTFDALVTVVDRLANTNTTSHSIEVVDTIPPTAKLTAPSVTYAEIPTRLDASNSTDNDEITTYNWSIGDDQFTTTDPVSNYTFAEAGSQTVELTTVDPSGNSNSTTAELSVRGAPTVSVVAPTPTALLGSDTVMIDYELSNTSFEGVSGVEYRLRNESTNTTPTDWTAGPYAATDVPVSKSLSTGSLADGNYSLDLRLADNEGTPLDTPAATDSVEFAVKTTPPTVDLVVESAGEFDLFGPNSPAVLTVTVDDPLDVSTVLSITAADGTNVDHWELSADTGNGEQTTVEWNATGDGTLVESGSYDITVTADDGIGNTAETTETIPVDTDTPTVDLAALTNVTTVENDQYFVNRTDRPDFEITATDGQPTAGTVDSIDIAVESLSTNHRHTLEGSHDGSDVWRGTFDTSRLGVEGSYALTLTATDRAGNSNRTVLAEQLVYSTSEPAVVGTIVDSNGTDATVVVRSNVRLADDPTATVTDPTDDRRTVALTANGSNWEGSFSTDTDGVYEFDVTATDRHGTTGSDTSSIRVETANSVDGELLIYNDRTGTFVHIETDRDVENQFVVVSESTRAPEQLRANQSPVGFLTSTLADELADSITTATVGIPLASYEPPAGLDPADDRLSIGYYNASTAMWDERMTRFATVDAGEFAPEIAGDYWLATVESFSTYGVTALNTEPPAITARWPAVDEQLAAGTDTITVDISYEDDLSALNVSAIELFVDGKPLTDDDSTDITSERLRHTDLALEDDASYTIELYLEDTAGNGQWYDYTFSVEAASTDDTDDDSGDDQLNGGGGHRDDSGDDGQSDNTRDDNGDDSREDDQEDDNGDDSREDGQEDDNGDDVETADTETDTDGDNDRDGDGGAKAEAGAENESDGSSLSSPSTTDEQPTETTDAEETDDSTPGFGVVAALAALVGSVLLARRWRR